MKRFFKNASVLLGCLFLYTAMAASPSDKVKVIEIDHPFATPTVPGAPTGAVYLSIANRSKSADRLLGASTPRAKRVELHAMSMAGDVMRMREVESIDVNPGQPVAMQPGSANHLMLVGLAAPLKSGERFPLTLRFEKAGNVDIEVPVQTTAPASSESSHHH